MRIILIRHGETIANDLYNSGDERLLIGSLDNELTQLNDTGRKQAEEAKMIMDQIHVDEIYSSDLTRAKETATIIFGDRKIHQSALLRERSLGSDEGKKAKLVFQNENVWKYHVNSEKDPIELYLSKKVEDGESYQMVLDRCKEFLSQFDYNEDKTIAVIGHFHLIRCMIYSLLEKEPDRELFTMMIYNVTPIGYEYIDNQFVAYKL